MLIKVIIKDRFEDIYPHNISICPNNCQLDNIEILNQRFNCYCNIILIIKI